MMQELPQSVSLNLFQAQESIFAIMNKADLSLQNLKQKAVFIVGEVSSGKSTFFNYINHVPTRVAFNEIHEPVYEHVRPIAKTGHGVKPITLIPNVANFENYSMVDMPGFESYMNNEDALIASYVARACLEKAKDWQFVLVVRS